MRKTKLLAVAMAAVVGMSSVPVIYRDVIVAEADENVSDTITIDEPTFLATYTAGKEITTDKKTMEFTSKTYSEADCNWHTPTLIVYSADDGQYNGQNYKHYANIRSDCWVADSLNVGIDNGTQKEYPSDWSGWLAACKEKAEVTVEYYKTAENVVTVVLTVKAGEYTAKTTYTFTADTDKKVYFSITGEKCTISGLPIEIEPVGEKLESVNGKYSETDKTTTFDKIECGNWWTNWSTGVEVTENEQKFSFKTTTNDTATVNYWTPVNVIFTSVDGCLYKPADSKNLYKEYAVIRSDNFVVTGGDVVTGDKFKVTGVPENDEAWATWLAANKAGVDVTGTVKREGDNVILTYSNNGISYVATIPVDNGKKAYLSLTGEQCTIENLKFEPNVSTEPSVSPSTAPSTAPNASTEPSVSPSAAPSIDPNVSAAPSTAPNASTEPSVSPSAAPSTDPNVSAAPSAVPNASTEPTVSPSTKPTVSPSTEPTVAPSTKPSSKPSNTTKKLKSATITVKNGKKKVSSVTVKRKKTVDLSVSVNSKTKLSMTKLSKKNAKIAKVTFKKNKLTIKGLKKGKISIKLSSKKNSKYKAATKTVKVTVK